MPEHDEGEGTIPKLAPSLQNDVKKAGESSGFKPVEEGSYRARLTEVKAVTAKSSGNPMWTWQFEIVESPYTGRKMWANTVLTDAALWKVAEMFDAFEVPTDTDTDELLGCTVVLAISQQEIPYGARKGQMGNNIDQVLIDESAEAVRHRAAGSNKAGGDTAPPAAAASAGADRF